MKLRIFASLLTALAIVASAVASAQATPDYTPRITVSPLVAPAGVVRTVTVSGITPPGCMLTSIQPVEHPAGGSSAALTLRLRTFGEFFSVCPYITDQPYSFTTTYTPSVAGRREVIAMNSGTSPVLGFGEIITSESATLGRGGTDITGVWYDPASNGSGIAFHHSHEDSGVLAGTFYGFDNTGRPFWYLIQNVRWSSATSFGASLVEISSQPGICVLLNGCNRLMQAAQPKGTFHGEILPNRRIRASIMAPLTFELVEVGRFDLQRIGF